jgi:hypothetical protein
MVVTYGDEIEEGAEPAGLKRPCFVANAIDAVSESLGYDDDPGDHCRLSSSSAPSRQNLGKRPNPAVIPITAGDLTVAYVTVFAALDVAARADRESFRCARLCGTADLLIANQPLPGAGCPALNPVANR